MSKAVKRLIHSELKSKFEAMEAGVVITVRGLDAEHMHDLRSTLNSKNMRLTVVKNSIAKLAAAEAGLPEAVNAVIDGQVGVAHGEAEAPELAKTIVEWSKKNKGQIEIKGGFLEKEILQPAEIADLAQLPTRPQMLGMFVGTIQAPIRDFVGVIQAPIRDFVGVLNAIKEKKEKEGGGEG